MNRDDKHRIVQELAQRIAEGDRTFYLADIGGMTVKDTTELRKLCHEMDIHLQVVKNKLVVKALESLEITDAALIGSLKGDTSIMIASNMKAPAELIKKFRKSYKKPLLKAAYIQEAVFVGDDKLQQVLELKSKEEILGEIIGILQSPAQRIVSAIQAPAGKLAGILSLEGEGKLADLGKKDDKQAA
ncbi:50S ribosomal protein L10 [bacterium]|nr:50S ribosomal protein L10 [bacterium]